MDFSKSPIHTRFVSPYTLQKNTTSPTEKTTKAVGIWVSLFLKIAVENRNFGKKLKY